ncbi:MAG: hypothetical protein QOD82_759, partial [Pseudonocardiales bacterium]|nr:hypothetical protein [Pseudonocardiales bacterium]
VVTERYLDEIERLYAAPATAGGAA